MTRQTYSCTPDCSPRMTLGDTSKDDFDKDSGLPADYFGKTLNQSITRSQPGHCRRLRSLDQRPGARLAAA